MGKKHKTLQNMARIFGFGLMYLYAYINEEELTYLSAEEIVDIVDFSINDNNENKYEFIYDEENNKIEVRTNEGIYVTSYGLKDGVDKNNLTKMKTKEEFFNGEVEPLKICKTIIDGKKCSAVVREKMQDNTVEVLAATEIEDEWYRLSNSLSPKDMLLMLKAYKEIGDVSIEKTEKNMYKFIGKGKEFFGLYEECVEKMLQAMNLPQDKIDNLLKREKVIEKSISEDELNTNEAEDTNIDKKVDRLEKVINEITQGYENLIANVKEQDASWTVLERYSDAEKVDLIYLTHENITGKKVCDTFYEIKDIEDLRKEILQEWSKFSDTDSHIMEDSIYEIRDIHRLQKINCQLKGMVLDYKEGYAASVNVWNSENLYNKEFEGCGISEEEIEKFEQLKGYKDRYLEAIIGNYVAYDEREEGMIDRKTENRLQKEMERLEITNNFFKRIINMSSYETIDKEANINDELEYLFKNNRDVYKIIQEFMKNNELFEYNRDNPQKNMKNLTQAIGEIVFRGKKIKGNSKQTVLEYLENNLEETKRKYDEIFYKNDEHERNKIDESIKQTQRSNRIYEMYSRLTGYAREVEEEKVQLQVYDQMKYMQTIKDLQQGISLNISEKDLKKYIVRRINTFSKEGAKKFSDFLETCPSISEEAKQKIREYYKDVEEKNDFKNAISKELSNGYVLKKNEEDREKYNDKIKEKLLLKYLLFTDEEKRTFDDCIMAKRNSDEASVYIQDCVIEANKQILEVDVERFIVDFKTDRKKAFMEMHDIVKNGSLITKYALVKSAKEKNSQALLDALQRIEVIMSEERNIDVVEQNCEEFLYEQSEKDKEKAQKIIEIFTQEYKTDRRKAIEYVNTMQRDDYIEIGIANAEDTREKAIMQNIIYLIGEGNNTDIILDSLVENDIKKVQEDICVIFEEFKDVDTSDELEVLTKVIAITDEYDSYQIATLLADSNHPMLTQVIRNAYATYEAIKENNAETADLYNNFSRDFIENVDTTQLIEEYEELNKQVTATYYDNVEENNIEAV